MTVLTSLDRESNSVSGYLTHYSVITLSVDQMEVDYSENLKVVFLCTNWILDNVRTIWFSIDSLSCSYIRWLFSAYMPTSNCCMEEDTTRNIYL